MRNHLRNLSNVYYNVSPLTIKNVLKSTLEQSIDSVSGLEIKLKQDDSQFTLITPSFIRYDKHSHRVTNPPNLLNCSLYEGYLHYPFFLPIYDNLDGEFIEHLQSLSPLLKHNEVIYMQWLFTKAFNWHETALDMYSSYILGNDHPLPIKFARKFQEGTIRLLGKFGSINQTRSYIEEAERKIVSDGYRFQLRIAINSSTERLEYLISKLEEVFNQYAYRNKIQLSKVQHKEFIKEMQERMITPDTKYQILSKREILSLFGGNEMEDENEIEVVEVQSETDNVSSAIELLPHYPMQQVVEREGLITDIAEALKRVGITSQARVYNSTVTTGIRLTVAQFDIPKDKNLTHITSKQKDIQAALGVESVSIEQGNQPNTVKMSIPNEAPSIIGLRSLLEMESFKEFSRDNPLSFVVGVDEINNPIYLSLAKLPHLLIAGTTGSGKSVFVNTLAVTLMLMNTPQELQMYMIDPKMVEFQHYEGFPHVKEVITNMDKAERIFEELTVEMDRRYSQFLKAGVKTIDTYNEKVLDTESDFNAPLMPYIVVIVDEYADLKDTNPEVESYIARLGQKARASGISLVLATQRPSVDVINSRVKSNVLNAISFNLGTTNNYRTVFGQGIPYNLLGAGDGVMKITGYHKEFQRFQSSIISTDGREEEQVYKKLVDYLSKKYKSNKQKDVITIDEESNDESEQLEDDNLYKLKQIIATTRITKTTTLREMLGVKNTTLTELMKQLVDENWLEKGKSNAEGYKLIASEDILSEWRNDDE